MWVGYWVPGAGYLRQVTTYSLLAAAAAIAGVGAVASAAGSVHDAGGPSLAFVVAAVGVVGVAAAVVVVVAAANAAADSGFAARDCERFRSCESSLGTSDAMNLT